MLDTLLKIGEWQRIKMSEWDPILEKPKIINETKKGDPVTNYIIGIVFDLDIMDVYPDTDLLKEYDEDVDPESFNSISILPGNNKAIYATVEPSKLEQLFKSFFGKPNNQDAGYGELIEAIDKDFSHLQESDLYQLIKDLFPLREAFLSKVWNTENEKFDHKKLFDAIELGRNEKLALVYANVKSKKHGYSEPTPISSNDDYVTFLREKFLENEASETVVDEKLCYASGEIKDDVTKLELTARDSFNKMFVTTTQNYATGFNEKLFTNNYQVGKNQQRNLDIAASFLKENYSAKIADINHLIIPQFIHSDNLDLGLALKVIKSKSDILFSLKSELNEIASEIETETDNLYWINFLAFESPEKKYFKTISLIKEVSKFHFQKIIEEFEKINWEFRDLKYAVDWNAATKEFGETSFFNLNSVYRLIPVRRDKEKKNVALQLFKSILENRKIEGDQLFQYFCELILCHYYKRYESYKNVRQYGKDYFGLAIRDSVFKYLAFFKVLKKLNLIDMEQEQNADLTEQTGNEYEKNIQDFFIRMGFDDSQKAMFFLGRILNKVVYMQKDKNKTVIEKINYNGMDKDDIVRLRIDLFEKAKQYGKTEKIVFNDSRFGQYFNFVDWNMNTHEAVFFILTGYSYGIVKKQDSNNQPD